MHFTCVCVLSHFSVRLFATLWTVACQVPLSMGFSRQEYWSTGLPCPALGDLPDPGIWTCVSSGSCIADGFSTAEPLGMPSVCIHTCIYSVHAHVMLVWSLSCVFQSFRLLVVIPAVFSTDLRAWWSDFLLFDAGTSRHLLAHSMTP